ncbi:hypothetical protein ASPZODRAFT_130892 [Penicilliopsis zonata CBS 506.65]|uniref:HCNGP-like protein n=1 Tax=Penicilliopsis zonata CBS 506.65 TaxID=1073090 RepID=A0A1L9SJM1_9EURO|nr:hypothetical protein ASPZODRAFT_130892 [Penicilliopsis zonata CBS 506.65]OJJ47432.1 hypothetical protein ASPZODRAFT_130892 [Penicilliopsis zonata CBS 506.65]
MLGLGAYQSSSEDDTEDQVSLPRSEREKKGLIITESSKGLERERNTITHAEPSGPVLGPLHAEESSVISSGPSYNSTRSPTSDRALIQDLTLPPVPDLNIPPSPPGSPNPAANAKIEHFLSLKTKGVHFNEKLAGSTSLRNPSLLKKLMSHAGITDSAQYNTSMPLEIWDPAGLPTWGFKEELFKSQKNIRQKTEEQRLTGQRDSIKFVSSGHT